MFLYVLLNDCVTFYWVSGAAFDQTIDYSFLPSIVIVVVVLIVSALFCDHSSFKSFLLRLECCLLMVMLIGMDSWLCEVFFVI
jgi:hypothetical protein